MRFAKVAGARHRDYQRRLTKYACFSDDEECRAAPLHATEGVSGQVRRKIQVTEQHAQLQQESHVRG